MKDRMMEKIIAHSKKYGASGHVPVKTIIETCPTCGRKEYKVVPR